MYFQIFPNLLRLDYQFSRQSYVYNNFVSVCVLEILFPSLLNESKNSHIFLGWHQPSVSKIKFTTNLTCSPTTSFCSDCSEYETISSYSLVPNKRGMCVCLCVWWEGGGGAQRFFLTLINGEGGGWISKNPVMNGIRDLNV